MALTSMVRACGTQSVPGTKLVMYVAIISELAATWPQTAAELGGTDKGDTKILGEAWDFSGAAAGAGYWRRYNVLVDTGQLRTLLEGEIGGNGYRQRLDVFLQGNGPVENEQADDFLGYSGCVIVMIGTKEGNYPVLGDLENPVFVESAEGGSGGDRAGFQYTFYANTGKTPQFYDVSLGIDETPNP